MLNQNRVTATETNGPEMQKKRGLREEGTQTQTSTSMFCGEEDGCQMSDGGGAWKGHVLFFLGAGSVSVCPSQGSKSRGGPKYGTGTGTHTVRYQSPMSNPACRIANTGPFSSLFSEGSVSTSTSHPSSSSPPTNQPPFAPSPLIPSRRHCDLLKLNPTRAATRGEGSRPDMEERGQERCGM